MADSPDRYQQILDAAERVFGEYGFAQARIETIAEHAGVAKGTVYLYFKGKDDLYASLVEDRVEQFAAMISAEMANADNLSEAIRSFVKTRIEFYQKHQGFMYTILESMTGFDSELRMRLVSSHDRVLVAIRELMARVLGIGVSFSPELAADVLVGAVNFVVASREISGESFDVDELTEELTTLLTEGLGMRGKLQA